MTICPSAAELRAARSICATRPTDRPDVQSGFDWGTAPRSPCSRQPHARLDARAAAPRAVRGTLFGSRPGGAWRLVEAGQVRHCVLGRLRQFNAPGTHNNPTAESIVARFQHGVSDANPRPNPGLLDSHWTYGRTAAAEKSTEPRGWPAPLVAAWPIALAGGGRRAARSSAVPTSMRAKSRKLKPPGYPGDDVSPAGIDPNTTVLTNRAAQCRSGGDGRMRRLLDRSYFIRF